MLPLPPPTRPKGVQAVQTEATSQFTQGKQARQVSDKLFGLNEAFLKAGPPTATVPVLPLESSADPGLSVAVALPHFQTSIHHVWYVTGTDVAAMCKVCNANKIPNTL